MFEFYAWEVGLFTHVLRVQRVKPIQKRQNRREVETLVLQISRG